MKETVRVAAAQYCVPPFDIPAGVDRICQTLLDASSRAVDFVVFPEAFLGGYPYWRGHVSVSEETELAARLWEVAVTPTDKSIEAIASTVVQCGVGAVIGANERDTHASSGTAYNSQLFFSPASGYIGSHRKLVPTHTERAYWGAGGANDLVLAELGDSLVGGLICYEHHMLPARLALSLAGEEIHCAAWPGYWETGKHLADKRPGAGGRHDEVGAAIRDYAICSQSFVVSSNAYLPDRVVPDSLKPIMKYNLARGGSSIVDPSGRYIATPVLDEEALVIGECHRRDRTLAKAYLDTAGHYTRWDIFGFELRPAIPIPRPVLGGSVSEPAADRMDMTQTGGELDLGPVSGSAANSF